MQSAENNKKALIRSATIYSTIVIVIALYGWLFLGDKYAILFDQHASVSAAYQQYQSMQSDGISAQDLQKLFSQSKGQKGSQALFKDMQKVGEAIKKPTTYSQDYLSWLLSENGKKSQMDEENNKNKQIIGNIIPTYAAESDDTNADLTNNLITFKSLVQYVEEDLLKKHSVQSYSSLGIGSISFGDGTSTGDKVTKKDTTDIGSFKISLDIEGTNNNLKSLLNDIQNSGKISIQNGKLVATKNETGELTKYSALSNLLLSVNNAKFDSALNDENAKNKLSLDLSFYVKGIGKDDLLELRGKLTNRFDAIKQQADTYSNCQKFKKACADGQGNLAVLKIQGVARDAAALKTDFDQMKGTITDVSGELDKAFRLNASLRSMEKTLQDNIAVINKFADTT